MGPLPESMLAKGHPAERPVLVPFETVKRRGPLPPPVIACGTVQHLHRGRMRQAIRTFSDLAEKLKMDVHDLMRQCNGKTPPGKALVKGLAKELEISESQLEKLAEEVQEDLSAQ